MDEVDLFLYEVRYAGDPQFWVAIFPGCEGLGMERSIDTTNPESSVMSSPVGLEWVEFAKSGSVTRGFPHERA